MNLPWVGTPAFWRVYVGGLILVAWLAPEPSPQMRSALRSLILVLWVWTWANNRITWILNHPGLDDPRSPLARSITRMTSSGSRATTIWTRLHRSRATST